MKWTVYGIPNGINGGDGMTFEEFVKTIREAEAKGEIKYQGGKRLRKFDLLVQYVISRIGDEKGYPCEITDDEIWYGIRDYAPEAMTDREIARELFFGKTEPQTERSDT